MDLVYLCIRMYTITYVLHTCLIGIIRLCTYNNINNVLYVHTYIFCEGALLLAPGSHMHVAHTRTCCQSLSVQEIIVVSRTADFKIEIFEI